MRAVYRTVPHCGAALRLCPQPRARLQDTYDDTGRRVRKARVKASQAIAEHAQWVTHNPYRMPRADGTEGPPDDEGAAPPGPRSAPPSRARAEDDEEEDEPGRDGERPSDVATGATPAPSEALPGGSMATGALGRSTLTGEEDDDAHTFTDGALLAAALRWRCVCGCSVACRGCGLRAH